MKFIGFFEYNNEDVALAEKTRRQLMSLREKEPNNYARLLSESYSLGGGDLPKLTRDFKGFSVYEADSIDQLANITLLYQLNIPSARVRFLPVVEASKAVELLMKAKK